MRQGKIIFIYFLSISFVFYFYSTEFSGSATPARTALTKQITTSYWPGAGGKIEGGWETSKPGPTGKFLPSTLEMVRTGQSNYVTVASDPSRYGEWYLIPEISYVNTKGEKYTLKNVKAYVHDTGGDFKNRPDKFDIAVDKGTGFSSGAPLDKLQSSAGVGFQGQKIVYLPSGGKSVTNTTSIPSTISQTPKNNNTTQTQTQTSIIPTQTVTPTRSSSPSSSNGGSMWVTQPYCYKHTGSASASELKMALTCNAGYICWYTEHGYACNYVADCGPNNASCNNAQYAPPNTTLDGPQAGCLNYKCKNKPNAIWDPQSKKCGCG